MKKKTWIFIIIGVLLLIAVMLFIIFSPIHFVKKMEGSIPYNKSNLYIPYRGSLFEISEDGMITQYSIGGKNEKSIQKTDSFRVELPVKKYISSNLFITEDDSIMFGDIKGTEHKKLGTVKNAADISVGTDQKGELTHTAVVTTDGLLYVQGDNSTGALGIEAKQVNGEFIQVPNLQNVTKAVCGFNCIFVLNTDGEVFLSGSLGNLSYQKFTKLEVPEKVKDIATSRSSQTLISLSVEGNVYEMGISFFKEFYFLEDASDYALFYSSFHKISRLKNIDIITTPDETAYAINRNGRTFYWGGEMIGKSIEMKEVFKRVYGIPKHDQLWYSGYFYILSDNEITAYSW